MFIYIYIYRYVHTPVFSCFSTHLLLGGEVPTNPIMVSSPYFFSVD